MKPSDVVKAICEKNMRQQRWNRYNTAINYCIERGFSIDIIDSFDKNRRWNGNIKAIRVKSTFDLSESPREALIPLQPRKYKGCELFMMIVSRIGLPKSKPSQNYILTSEEKSEKIKDAISKVFRPKVKKPRILFV